MSQEMLADKFCRLSGRVLGDKRAEELSGYFNNLSDVKDIRDVTKIYTQNE
jgi:hypothetical protein